MRKIQNYQGFLIEIDPLKPQILILKLFKCKG